MAKPVPVLLMTRTLDLGGTERQLTVIAKSLDRSRFEPHVACFHPEGIRGEELRSAGVPIAALRVTSFRSMSLPRGVARMGAYVRQHRIRLVHTFDVPANIFGVPAARLLRVPHILSSQRAFRSLTPGIYRHLLRATDFLVDGIVVNSANVRESLMKEDSVPERKIHLCYNGLDTLTFHPPQTVARIRTEPVVNAPVVIGLVCALRPEKDIPTLLRAFQAVHSRCPTTRLVIVGSGPSEAEIKEIASNLNIAEHCHFEPSVQDVRTWLHAIDIFVLPSKSEAMSNSLMEAMACGCCVVASAVGGNVELVADNRTGFTFAAGDSNQLAVTLHKLVTNSEMRLSIANAGTQFIRSSMSVEASIARMQEIYTNTLSA